MIGTRRSRGGQVIVWGDESGEEGLDCHVANAPRNDVGTRTIASA
jgi:hypothetical protein